MARKRLVSEELRNLLLSHLSEEVAGLCLELGAEALLKRFVKKEGWLTDSNVELLAKEGPQAFKPKKPKKLAPRDKQLLETLILLRITKRKVVLPVDVSVEDFVKAEIQRLATELPTKRDEFLAEIQNLRS